MLNSPLPLNIIVCQENGQPIIELRQRIRNLNLLKAIVGYAFNDQPLVVMPCFSNRLRSINSLIEKGVLKKIINNDNSISYDFLI